MNLHAQRTLARRLPFFYRRLVLAFAMCASFARQATAVAILSVFVVPFDIGISAAGTMHR